MRKILLTLTILIICVNVFAQTSNSPFKKLGYKKYIMYTSSKGEFEEFYDDANVVEIGSVLFNTKTNQVVGFIDEQQEETEVTSATPAMSIDPLCEKYYWITPYAYCANNPVKYVDPDGKAFVIAIPWIVGGLKSLATALGIGVATAVVANEFARKNPLPPPGFVKKQDDEAKESARKRDLNHKNSTDNHGYGGDPGGMPDPKRSLKEIIKKYGKAAGTVVGTGTITTGGLYLTNPDPSKDAIEAHREKIQQEQQQQQQEQPQPQQEQQQEQPQQEQPQQEQQQRQKKQSIWQRPDDLF